jgi:hypothetical protein
VLALVVGIVALLLSWTLYGNLMGLVSIVLGAVGMRRTRGDLRAGRKLAVGGVVLGVVSVLVLVGFAIYTVNAWDRLSHP